MIAIAKQRFYKQLVRTLFTFLLVISLPLTLATGNTTSTLPIDSLSSEGLSHTSLVSSGEEILSLSTDFSKIYQEDIIIGEPVEMYQLITLRNVGDVDVSGIFSLASYPDVLPLAYVDEALDIVISSDGEIIAQDYYVYLSLAPGETKELYIDYTFVPVEQSLTCEEQQIIDMLPHQADVISSDIALDEILGETCTLTLSHEGTIHYYDVHIDLEGFNLDNITSIYYVQGNQYLSLDGSSIRVPKPEE